MIRLYTDAAVNMQTNNGGIGFVIKGDVLYEQISIPLSGTWDNHTAEWKALDTALAWLIKNQFTDQMVFVFTDSQVVAESVQKEHTKNESYKPFLINVQTKIEHFPLLEIQWIPEKKNKGADNLAKQALRKAYKY